MATSFRRADAASLALVTIVFRLDNEASTSASAPDPVSELAEDVGSDLPSVFPRGVAGLFEDGGLEADSFGDGCGWERNFPRFGAFEDMVFAEKRGRDIMSSLWEERR